MVPRITRRLQNKLIFAFVVVLLIPTGIISFYSVSTAASTLIQKIGAEELRSLVSQANDTEKRLISVKEDLIFLSLAPPTRRYATVINGTPDPNHTVQDAEIALFRTFLDHSENQYVDFRIIDLAGEELLHISSTGELIPIVPEQNFAGEAYFNQAIGLPTNQVYISDYDLSRTEGVIDQPYVPILYYSVPLEVDGANVAVLVATVSLRPLFTEMSGHSITPLYLVNRDGSYLLNPDPTHLFGRMLNDGVLFDTDRSRSDVIAMFGESQGIITDSSDYPDSLQVFVHIRPETQISIRWLLFRVIPISTIVGEINGAQQVAVRWH
ncbi:MAG: hypothetical protein U0670_22385 [Anaerolineae bacterium]